jgi:hypothetical protein
MNQAVVVVKYYSEMLLLTVDINVLFSTLFESFGDRLAVQFVPMNESERTDATEPSSDSTNPELFIPFVLNRFTVYQVLETGVLQRCENVEQRTVHRGRK